MSRSNIALFLAAFLLAGLYVYYFTDWINPPRIQIISQLRPFKPANGENAVYPITFAFDGAYKLTSVKVVKLDALATNKNATPVWYMVTKSNSPPNKGFMYGRPIPGMVSYLSNSPAKKLDPDSNYRLTIEAGRARGQIDFRTRPE